MTQLSDNYLSHADGRQSNRHTDVQIISRTYNYKHNLKYIGQDIQSQVTLAASRAHSEWREGRVWSLCICHLAQRKRARRMVRERGAEARPGAGERSGKAGRGRTSRQQPCDENQESNLRTNTGPRVFVGPEYKHIGRNDGTKQGTSDNGFAETGHRAGNTCPRAGAVCASEDTNV